MSGVHHGIGCRLVTLPFADGQQPRRWRSDSIAYTGGASWSWVCNCCLPAVAGGCCCWCYEDRAVRPTAKPSAHKLFVTSVRGMYPNRWMFVAVCIFLLSPMCTLPLCWSCWEEILAGVRWSQFLICYCFQRAKPAWFRSVMCMQVVSDVTSPFACRILKICLASTSTLAKLLSMLLMKMISLSAKIADNLSETAFRAKTGCVYLILII